VSTSIIERTKAALRRLGTHACEKCGKLMPGMPGRACDPCIAKAIRADAKRSRETLERDQAAVKNILANSSSDYRREVRKYRDHIEEAMADWQIGNGILGQGARD